MTYCFCQTSENSELMVQGSSTHPRKLATVLLWRQPFVQLWWIRYTREKCGHDFYLRQLRDMKTSVEIEGMSETDLKGYSHLCGWALAHSHARSGNRFAISGYLGQSNTFEQAIANFAVAYADQTERDYKALADAIAAGQIKAIEE
ncbi:DUF2252 domain-containing protein [Nostoc sp. C052]|nr:DUF2252 family protein [Nostoc sp. C052]QLE44439.1 DUF2252 domain-containing protein [Nostoc sp. C052]